MKQQIINALLRKTQKTSGYMHEMFYKYWNELNMWIFSGKAQIYGTYDRDSRLRRYSI